MNFSIMFGIKKNIYHNKLSSEFCDHFYNQFQNNFSALDNLFGSNAKITFFGNEYIGFNSLKQSLQYYQDIHIIQHQIKSITSQPLNLLLTDTLLISVIGVMIINNNKKIPFSDTFVLCKNNNLYYIDNYISEILTE